MACTHTVSTDQRFTFYQLKLVPGHPTSYYVNGKACKMGTETAVVARAGREAVRPLRRGGAEGWWHDSPAWGHRVVDEYRCGLARCTRAGMAQLAQAAQPTPFLPQLLNGP